MNPQELQATLLQTIRTRLAPHLSLADEIAQTLCIGSDSAYRRIRGEKQLSLEELQVLCTRYQVSADQLFGQQAGGFIFQGKLLETTQFRFDKYLEGIIMQLKYIGSFPESHMFYMCKDIPVFYHFQYRDLAAFKYYFWMRAIIDHPEFTNKPFRFEDYSDELYALGVNIIDCYNRFPSSELWNVESINSTIQQINFCRDMGLITSSADLQRIYQSLEQLIRHLEAQAAEGIKWHASGGERSGAAFGMYHNEFILGDNSILATTGPRKVAFLIHSVINYVTTHDVAFCDHLYNNVHNLMKRSTLISTDSEVERNAFFRLLYRKLAQSREPLPR